MAQQTTWNTTGWKAFNGATLAASRQASPDIPTLVQRAAAHYERIRENTPPTEPVIIHVYPAKKTGNSARFRVELAQRLLNPNDRTYVYPSDRSSLETRLEVQKGYIFAEINLDEWST